MKNRNRRPGPDGRILAKALKRYTDHTVLGLTWTLKSGPARSRTGRWTRFMKRRSFSKECAVSFICLFPVQTVEFIKENLQCFQKGSIVADICGVKSYVVNSLKDIPSLSSTFLPIPWQGGKFAATRVRWKAFCGGKLHCHPLDAPRSAVESLESLVRSIGFTDFVVTTPEDHDRIIALPPSCPISSPTPMSKAPAALDITAFPPAATRTFPGWPSSTRKCGAICSSSTVTAFSLRWTPSWKT